MAIDLKKMGAARNDKLADAKRLLEEIDNNDCSDWEAEFLENVAEALAEGRALSSAQLEKLREIHSEHS